MKKFIIMFALLMGCLSTFAQTNVYFESKATDNVYVGVNGGVSMPLTMNSVMPVNAQGSIRVGKDFTPIFGAFVEGTAIFGDNVGWGHDYCYSHTFVKASNVGINGTVNWMNLCGGYKGQPRTFEIISIAGLGWYHTYGNNDGFDKKNSLSSKTALDFLWNVGKKKSVQIYIEPNILWNLSATNAIQFNKNYAQLGLNAGINYKFNNSYNSHNFRSIDIDALNDELNRLRAENAALQEREPRTITHTVTQVVPEFIDRIVVVPFAQNSDELSAEARTLIGNVNAKTVSVVGYASPEGTAEYNQKLSESRANVVKKVLESNGIKVSNCEGRGAVDNQSNRIVKIIAE